MRHLVALVLLPAVLAQGCASAATSHPQTGAAATAGQAPAADVARLQAINDDLAGEPATIELTSGEIVQKAQSLRLGTEVTSWYDSSGRQRTVQTAEVRRVLREQRHLIGRGFGYGAAAAVLPAYLVAQNYKSHDPFSGAGGFAEGLLIVVGGGLIGMVVAAASRHPVVVFEAPQAPRAAAAGSVTELRCHLAPAATGDRLDCTPNMK
jgi:hypothetical protein